jgi:hypothetical protein
MRMERRAGIGHGEFVGILSEARLQKLMMRAVDAHLGRGG